ncbi:DUF3427 domain-containing protein [Lactobacillus corticis]|uniref:Helicase n=1 Tax=Lactobacillus corticis TaxID=2201249 RepID=A0A916VIV6_9LACO|nr:DEAD/DEAH box helicase [Lactobacillus corticis]GFZ27763.1 helicase [Lactobacillus corticis]
MSNALEDAVLNGLISQNYPGHEMLGPQLLANRGHERIWPVLRQELLTADHFIWAVAFITQDMLVPLKAVLADLADQGVSGTLITGDYLGFNNPQVFRELMKIPNLEVRLASGKFHAKGYWFDHGDAATIVIGSANFTRSALLENYEWALKITSRQNAHLAEEVGTELQRLAQKSQPLTRDWIDQYAASWIKPTSRLGVVKKTGQIKPNKMQQAALKELQQLVASGKKRGLVISATGTGKTYLGAFAVKAYQPKRFLYLVHREQIAKKAMLSFQKVLGGDKQDYGMLTGHERNFTAKYTFATVQTVSQKEVLDQLDKDHYDYILIDEAHRAAAPSYQRIFAHFKPQFWLGMTATPDRMDQQDVYGLFDYNLAYEIRLREALEADMLTPFHYVGVADYEADGQVIDETSDLRYLTTDQRVDYILKELDYYGWCGKRPRGLVYCSRQEEARKLAAAFTQRHHPAQALTNTDSEAVRQTAVADLEQGKLEYLVTVDLFNEGIDVPSLNQVVMLRNTQSNIVFTQQLGRGLRKYPGKEYLTVIDFIGNYKNNYLIPLALNQDNSRDRDQAERETKLPTFAGLSTINFTKVASERILGSLEKVKLDSLANLRAAYRQLHQQLGRMPLLADFNRFGSVAPQVFADLKLPNYGHFLQKMGEPLQLTAYEDQVLTFMTKELLKGKRLHELLLLKMLEQGAVSQAEYKIALEKHGAYCNEDVLQSVDWILGLSFFEVKTGKTTRRAQYGDKRLIEFHAGQYQLAASLTASLQDHDFKTLFDDVLATGLALSRDYDQSRQFTLYRKYDREDVCRLLNWPLDVSAPMYGYRVGDDVCPIFITYKKQDTQKRNAIYNNQLADGRSLRWYTRSPRHLDSDEVKRLLKPDMRLEVFVKRSDASKKDFYYLGTAQVVPGSAKEELLGKKKRPAVGMDLLLQTPLTNEMYELLFAD